MRIVFVRPNVDSRFMIVPPIGLGYVAAAARRAGHDVTIYDAWLHNETPRQAAPAMMGLQPDMVGIQVYYNTVEWTRKFIMGLPAGIKTMVGGPQITAKPHSIEADVIVQGMGEEYFTGKPFDINDIPMPAWDLLNLPAYWPFMKNITVPRRGKRIAVIQRTRGCDHRCTFCAGHVVNGHKVSIRIDGNVLDEIAMLISVHGVDEIWFQDDNAISDYDRALILFDKLAEYGLHIRLPNGIRTENVTPEMVHAMQRAGVYFTGIGIESGNARVLKRIRKHINLEWAKCAIELLDDADIMTSGFFILGLPTETEDEIEDTIRYALSTRLKFAQFGIFTPYPGIEDENKTSNIPPARLKQLQRSASMMFYARPLIVWNILKRFQLSQGTALLKHPWIRGCAI